MINQGSVEEETGWLIGEILNLAATRDPRENAGNWSRAARTAKTKDVAEGGRNCDVPIKEGRGSSVVCRYHPQKRREGVGQEARPGLTRAVFRPS